MVILGVKCGYGLGGSLGNKGLPGHLVQRFKSRSKPERDCSKSEEINVLPTEDETSEQHLKRRKKRKEVYGVNQKHFYAENVSQEGIEEITQTRSIDDKDKREAVYEAHRESLQNEFTMSKKNIYHICRGFFEHHDHLAKHFSWLTNAGSLIPVVEENLVKQLDYMFNYICYVNTSQEFKDKLLEVESSVETNYEGSRIFKDIFVMRETGTYLDKDGKSLVRFREELPPSSGSPFVLAVEVDKVWVFELWCDQKKLLGNMSLSVAIGSFLHLAEVETLS